MACSPCRHRSSSISFSLLPAFVQPLGLGMVCQRLLWDPTSLTGKQQIMLKQTMMRVQGRAVTRQLLRAFIMQLTVQVLKVIPAGSRCLILPSSLAAGPVRPACCAPLLLATACSMLTYLAPVCAVSTVAMQIPGPRLVSGQPECVCGTQSLTVRCMPESGPAVA